VRRQRRSADAHHDRAFHEAVFIFNNRVRKPLKEHRPTYVAAIFESSGPTHRQV
jgi:hypothetical protein